MIINPRQNTYSFYSNRKINSIKLIYGVDKNFTEEDNSLKNLILPHILRFSSNQKLIS